MDQKRAQDISASFFRQIWLLAMLKKENEWFCELRKGTSIDRLMKNTIITIDANLAQAVRLLPNCKEIIEDEITNEKLDALKQVIQHLTYCNVEQLEKIEDWLTAATVEVKDDAAL